MQPLVKYQKDGIKPTGRITSKICISSSLNIIFIDEIPFFEDKVQKKIEKSCFFRLIEICLPTQN